MNDLERFFSLLKEAISSELKISTKGLETVEYFPAFFEKLPENEQIKVMKLSRKAWDTIYRKEEQNTLPEE